MSFKKVLTNLHLVEDEEPIVPLTTPAPLVAPVEQTNPNYSNWQQHTLTPSDPEMVNKIKSSVFGASNITNQFMKNLDLVRPQFPNDEIACMKATLAFMQTDKNVLISELNRTVSAALLHTKNNLENEHKKARDAAVGGLESQLQSINSDIATTGNQITQLQQSLIAKQSSAVDLQGKIKDAEMNLEQQDAVVKGSLAQVEQYVTTLAQTFGKL